MKLLIALVLCCVSASCGGSHLGGSAGTAGSAGGTTGIGGGTGGEFTLTEWQIPFSESQPFQIATLNANVVYLTKDVEEHVGLLDVTSGVFTEWLTPYTTTSPGDIEVRAADQMVFIAGATLNEIGQFAPLTGTLTRWKLPTTAPDSGPWSLAFGAGTLVFFSANDDAGVGYIGRLDTATGNLTTWSFPGAGGSRVVAAPDGTVLFQCWDGTVPYQLARLNPASGVFTSWPMTAQPLFPIIADAGGTISFADWSSVPALARFLPSTGRLTEWTTPGLPDDSLALLQGWLYFGVDGDPALHALDISTTGRDSTIAPSTEAPVVTRTFQISPSTVTLTGQQAQGYVSQRQIAAEFSAPFATWSIQRPRMKAAIVNALYFTEDDHGVIARLTR